MRGGWNPLTKYELLRTKILLEYLSERKVLAEPFFFVFDQDCGAKTINEKMLGWRADPTFSVWYQKIFNALVFLCKKFGLFTNLNWYSGKLLYCSYNWFISRILINPFNVTGLFLCSQKTSENQRFSDVFREI